MPVAQEQILAREHRAESARSRKKQAAAEAAAGKSTVTGGNLHSHCHGLLTSSTYHCLSDQLYACGESQFACLNHAGTQVTAPTSQTQVDIDRPFMPLFNAGSFTVCNMRVLVLKCILV